MKPPAIARTLVRLLAPKSERRFLLDDLDEEFERLSSERGRTKAARWYWRQALTSVRPLLTARSMAFRKTLQRAPGNPAQFTTDLWQAVLWLRRNRAVAATVTATLAIASATVLVGIAVIDAILLRPLPFPDADRVVNIAATSISRPNIRGASLQDVDDWRIRSSSFDAISAYTLDSFRLTGRGDPRQIQAERVGRDFERVLGVAPLTGRLFADADFTEGGSRVVVLTHAFWQEVFGASRAVLESTILLNEQPYRVVGILPRLNVSFPEPHDVWIPLVTRRGAFWETSRATAWVSAVGRIKPETTAATARAELSAIAARLAAEFPASNSERTTASLVPISEELIGPLVPALRVLAIAVGSVLLIACGNVAMLLLASSSRRRGEFAVRAALGADRRRIGRQLALEAGVLCTIGVAVGTAIAPGLCRSFLALYPTPLPRPVDAVVTPLVLAAAVLIAAVATVLIAIPQAFRVPRSSTSAPLAGVRTTAAPGERAAGFALVALQVALSLALVVASAALVRTLIRLSAVAPGYRPEGVLTITATPSPQRFPTAAASLAFYDSALESIRQLPGVRDAAAAVAVPLTSSSWRFGVRPPGATADVLVGVNLVSSRYFETLGIRILEGRALTASEQRSGSGVAMVSTALARLLFPAGESAIGRHFDYSNQRWEIVGVVDAARHGGPRSAPLPELFIPWRLAGKRPQTIVVRADGDPRGLTPILVERLRAIDPTVPLDVQTLSVRMQKMVAADRFRSVLLALMAVIGVVLAALGAYATTAYAVARRTREYGIRLALGERPRSILRRALWTAVAPALTGIAAGATASAASTQLLNVFVYEVSTRDPVVVVSAAAALVGVVVLAATSSAVRAASVDPVNALRVD